MSAPAGVVDLSLPNYPTLIARAGVNPDAEAQRVAGGAPGSVAATASAFAGAGGEIDTAWTQSMGAADTLGGAFTNNGAPVLDRSTHIRNLPPEFGDAGTRLVGASRRIGAVADDLTATMQQTAAAVTGLHTELGQRQASWAQQVSAAGTAEGGLIPEAAIPGLLAERDRIAAEMTTRVATVGQQVTQRIRSYEVVINDALRLLADQGFVPPQQLDTPPPPLPVPAYEGAADPAGLGTPLMAGYAADPVNTALGNFVEVETDLAFAGLLAGLTIARTYNSRSDRIGEFGARWSSWADVRLVEHTWTAEYEGPDGQRISFPRTGATFGTVTGIHALVERTGSGLALAWFDGRRWDFDATGRLQRTWAGPGTAVQLRYDEAGRLTELTHERGRRVLLDRHPELGRIVAAVGSDGRRVDYRYDEAGQLLEAAGPAGPRRYGIDAHGRVESVTDADGVLELVNTYDRDGRVLSQRSSFGRLVTFGYQPDGVTVVADDSAGPRNTYRHDHAGRLLAATDGHGHTQHKRYDAAGHPVEVVERGGAVTRQEFDDRAHLVRRSLSSGAVFTLTWDAADRITSITAAGSELATATTRFDYQGAERVPSEIIDPEGGRTRLQVVDGVVQAMTDPDGVTVRLRHDVDGQLIEAIDAAGGVARIERDPAGRPVTVCTPAGRRTELSYDQNGRLRQRRDPAGGVWHHEYTAAGREAAVIDPTGARTETRYGPHGEACELVDALGAGTGFRYDDFGNLAGATAVDGAKWAYTYDALSRLTAWTDPSGGSWLREHDAEGRCTATIDPTGVREDRSYDPMGRLTGTDDGLVASTFGYDELGRPVTEVRADGATLHAGYDRCGRRTSGTGPDGGITRFDHTPGGRPLRITRPSGREQGFVHDACGRLSAWIDGNGQRWEQRYDPDGLLIERITPTGLVQTWERDAAGRVTRHRIPGRGTVGYTYDPAGRVIAMADRAGLRRFDYDAAGRVVAATDALGHTVRYGYDQRGRLVSSTDPLGGRTERGYDELGRLCAETDPIGRTTRLSYDAAGRAHEQIDPTGTRRRITRDRSGRTATITATHATGQARTITIDRDALGRPTRIDETGATPIELRWDPAGRLTERRTGARSIGWHYDADGLRTELINPDGTRTGYLRDGAGRVTGWTHPLLGPVELDRDPDGRLLGMTGTSASSRWSYSDGWLDAHHRTRGDRQHHTRLTRDEHGRVVTEETDGRLRLFGYDQAGQLVHTAAPEGDRRYRFDPAGRLTAETGPDGERGYRYDAAGQLTGSTGPDGERRYRYDEAGRRIAEDGPAHRRRYHWDGFGRLAGIESATHTTSLRVDALGELTDAGDTPLAWDSADPMSPLAALGEDTLIGVGSPWAATGGGGLDPDWQHTPARAAATDPWGAAPDGVALGFRGELALDGLLWLRDRAYDPATRAFLQVDPLAAIPGTGYSGNPYHYAGNDPVNALDPLGQRPVTDADLAEQRDEDGGGWLSDLGHGVLDVVGLVPGVGEVADLANAAWYTAEGDYLMAGLSAAAAIPFAGWGATGAKVAIKGGRAIAAETAETAASRAARELTEGVGPRIPNDATIVRGGTTDLPPPGEVFSGSSGTGLNDAAAGVPHGQIRSTTAGDVRQGGGSVEYAPEFNERVGKTNYQHVDVTIGPNGHGFGDLGPNPVPKRERFGGPDYPYVD